MVKLIIRIAINAIAIWPAVILRVDMHFLAREPRVQRILKHWIIPKWF